jgi:hypothetical protein
MVKIVVPVWGNLEMIGVMQGLNYVFEVKKRKA